MDNPSTRLYRIISFHHAVQIFERGELYFSRPSSWDDPYETRLTHRDLHKIYAQCWCTRGVSDAMWRIYSPDHLGIRIATSIQNLRNMLEVATEENGYKLKMGPVTYHKQHEINSKAKLIKSELKSEFNLEKPAELMFMKRQAYDHESEYRAVIISPHESFGDNGKGLTVKVNAKKLINSILIDPRAPDELSSALIYYFNEKVGFTKKIRRSTLYKTPKAMVVD